MDSHCKKDLPPILAGPILRHVSTQQMVVWVLVSEGFALKLACYHEGDCLIKQSFQADHAQAVRLGEHVWLHLLVLDVPDGLPVDCWLEYDLGVMKNSEVQWLQQTLPHVMYEGHQRPCFVIKSHIDVLLHGSCRKPHYPDRDGLLVVDEVLEQVHKRYPDIQEQPALLFLTGDQVYVDDVAGPMLFAIHRTIDLLGLYDEVLEGASVADSQELYKNPLGYYQRAELLPDNKPNARLRDLFFSGARKPIFTTANADNHLISLAEVIAMYALTWSPMLWRLMDLSKANLPGDKLLKYQEQLPIIRSFADGLDKVQRALAQVPVYMIFDDHDVTDDWNLNRSWEETAYANPLSRRIIGNALMGYLLCQGWGNHPESFPEQGEVFSALKAWSRQPDLKTQNQFIDVLMRFEGWQYTLSTSPKLVVLDTRTRRWRSESNANKPSGLMDWEALSELQQELLNESCVIMVSAAPIFGVKLIEVIQRIFTWFGHALTVDAENWMSHPGSANVILNIFLHKRTPHHFVILSGDVHYSFAYDVRLRHRQNSPKIWQISGSGIKNIFPKKLLRVFDRCNRWLFASHSPLNWFTRRRHMHIRPRRPSEYSGRYRHQRLVNGCGMGVVRFNEEGAPTHIEVLMANGESVQFTKGYESDWV